jgi:hypothetical protein
LSFAELFSVGAFALAILAHSGQVALLVAVAAVVLVGLDVHALLPTLLLALAMAARLPLPVLAILVVTASVAATTTVVAIIPEHLVPSRNAPVVAPDRLLRGALARVALAFLAIVALDAASATVLVVVVEPLGVAALVLTSLPDLALLALLVGAVVIVVAHRNRGDNALHEQEPGEQMKKLHDGSSSRLTSSGEGNGQTRVLNSSKRVRLENEGMRR